MVRLAWRWTPHVSAFVFLTLLATGTSRASSTEEASLSFELAFDRSEFVEGAVISPDGRWLAYSVRRPPRDQNLDSRYQSSGSPSAVVGSRLFVQKDGEEAKDICPGAGNCWRPSWSPDSRALAFYSDAEGLPQLWLFKPRQEAVRRLSPARIKAKLWAGDHARWSPDAERLYVPLSPGQSTTGDLTGLPAVGQAAAEEGEGSGASSDRPQVTVLGSGSEAPLATGVARPMASFMMLENNAALASIDLGGTVLTLVDAETAPRPSVLRISPSGRWLTYLSVFKSGSRTSQATTYDLGLVRAEGGEVITLAEDLPVGNDYHGQNYSWHPREDLLVYLRDDSLWLVDLRGEKPGMPRRLGADVGELTPVPLWFTRDGEAVVVGTDPYDPGGYFGRRAGGLARVPLDGEHAQKRLIDDEWQLQQMVRANETTLWQPDPQSVHLMLRNRTSGESAMARLDFSRDGLEVVWRGIARVRGLAASSDHRRLVGIYEDIGTPPDIFSFTNDFERTRLTTVDARLTGVALPKAEIIETDVPLHDGSIETVRTAILLPPGAQRGDRLPAVVMIYPGGDVTRHVESYGGGATTTVPTLLFLSRGFAVVLVNLRLGPNLEPGNPMQEMVDVLLPQVYRAAQLGYVDVARLGIAGQSFGGYGTAAIVSRTNLFRAAVAISGIYDLGGTYGHLDDDQKSFFIGWSEGGQVRMGNHPWADIRRYVDNSPYYQADKIRTPLLLLHGDEDRAIHDAEKLFSALRRLDRDVQLAIYRDQGHVVLDWRRAEAIDAAERMLEFFGRHLLGD